MCNNVVPRGKFLHLFPHKYDLLFKSDAAKDLICGEFERFIDK